MNARSLAMPPRRGACPGLSQPMPTGDGILVRLYPIGTIALAAFSELCGAARRHGNGIIEITSRGSIQVRGLSEGSAPQFAADIAALGIAAEGGVPVHCSPLAGIDAEEIFDSAAMAADLRSALARGALATRLGAKVSIAVDGGGTLGLARLPSDIRLIADAEDGGGALRISVGGDEAAARFVGVVARSDAIKAAVRLLAVLAERGPNARARDVVAAEDVVPFRSAISDLPTPAYSRISGNSALSPRFRGDQRNSEDAIGTHRLQDGSLACGIALAFGHAGVAALERLVERAVALDVGGFRTAPGRALMAIGLSPETAPDFVAAADKLGFIVYAGDPRRHVVACAGAPICGSAHIAARALAPLIADRIAPHCDDAFAVHLSGCAKGCAQATPAALTVIGLPEGCALVVDGSVRDAPYALVPTGELPAAILRFVRERRQEAARG
jgi:precorrin-3B synthase